MVKYYFDLHFTHSNKTSQRNDNKKKVTGFRFLYQLLKLHSNISTYVLARMLCDEIHTIILSLFFFLNVNEYFIMKLKVKVFFIKINQVKEDLPW